MYNYPEGDILKGFDEVIIPPSVDRGVRFANYLIDYILSFGFLYLFTESLKILLQFIFPDSLYWMAEHYILLSIWNFTISLAIRPLYFALLEGLAQGRTVGKLITGTVAIRTDGQPLTWRDVFGRSYARVVPFEAWSGFAQPWHDRWTDTTVVYKRDLVTM
jgi:uncharacterized RDD family membrane protein YckC